MTIIDITYTTNIGERHGCRRMYDNHTGEVWWDPLEPDAAAQNLPVPDPLGPVEPLPEASVEQPSADPAPPLVDLLGIREKELDEAFKPLGAKVDAEVLMPEPEKVTHVHKPKTKKLHHG